MRVGMCVCVCVCVCVLCVCLRELKADGEVVKLWRGVKDPLDCCLLQVNRISWVMASRLTEHFAHVVNGRVHMLEWVCVFVCVCVVQFLDTATDAPVTLSQWNVGPISTHSQLSPVELESKYINNGTDHLRKGKHSWCGCCFFVCVCVCVCFRNTSRQSASLRSACSRTTTWPTRPSCTGRPSRAERGTSASTGTDRWWRGTASRRPRELHTSCPNSSKVQPSLWRNFCTNGISLLLLQTFTWT